MQARWYDPRTGVKMAARPDIRKDGSLPGRPAPSGEDWVFVLELEHD
jgi:hypothetical protein